MRGLLQHWTRSSHNSHFKRKISLEEQKPRKRTVSFEVDRLPTWSTNNSGSLEPIVLSRPTPTCSLLLFEMVISGIRFEVGWNITVYTKIPPDDILEGLYKLRIRESDKLKTVLELYGPGDSSEEVRTGFITDWKLWWKEVSSKKFENKNFEARSGNFEKNAGVKNQG